MNDVLSDANRGHGATGAKVLDTDQLTVLQSLDEDGSFLGELIQEFRRDAIRLVVEASAGLRDLKEDPICRAAHSLKGASSSLGMLGFSCLCLELEELGHARRFDLISEKLRQLEIGMEESLCAVEKFRRGAT